MNTKCQWIGIALLMSAGILRAGTLSCSNWRGFDTNPVVSATSGQLNGSDPVTVRIGTFDPAPSETMNASAMVDASAYANLLAGFTAYGNPVGLVPEGDPLGRKGTFFFQQTIEVAGTPLAGKPVYLFITRGTEPATATEVAILRTNMEFEPAEDLHPQPRLLSIGARPEIVSIAGSFSRFDAAPTGLNTTDECDALSLATILPPAEIVVEYPPENGLVDGEATIDFGSITLGSISELTFRIRNTGESNLDLNGSPAITISGLSAAQFAVIAPPATPILPGGETSFTIRFSATIAGNASATLQLASNDADENPFDILLTGNALNPEIAVEQPAGTDIPDGGTKGFGTVLVGGIVDLVFTVKNIGEGDLTFLNVSLDGADVSDFTVITMPTAPLAGSGGITSFAIRFSPTASGAKSAALHIASNDADESSFDITLTGQALSPNDDTDGDGLNDAAEFQMAALGYDWQVSQPALVGTLFTNSNFAGLYTQGQIRTLHAGTPLITRNPDTGRFTLTMDFKKSWDLQNFADFPAQAAEVSVNPAGDILFEFNSPDDAAFFRVQVE